MRLLRLATALLAFSLVATVVSPLGPLALGQSTEEAEDAVDDARARAEAATGLVDEAVENRAEIEAQLAESISRLNDLSAQLSQVGASIDRIATQAGHADVELAGIASDIQHQAVSAYMTVVASPSVTVINSKSVEEAMVAGKVVEDVVADGRATVSELTEKRTSLEELRESFLSQQADYQALQAEMKAEVERFTSLYEEADAEVAKAIRDAERADQKYREALTALEIAEAKEAEARRQAAQTTTTTTPSATTSTSTGGPTTTPPSSTSCDTGRTWNHPPAVEQWRGLVEQYFPEECVEEALRILNCESNGDPNAINPYSSASGLFQFLPSTWASTAPKAGWAGYSPFHPEANTSSAAWLANRYEQLGLYYWMAWSCKRVLK